MLPNFMQCLLFALCQLVTSYLKSSFYLKQLFSQNYLSSEVCMIYPDSYWLNAYLYPLWACPPLCGFGAWNFLSMAIKKLKF